MGEEQAILELGPRAALDLWFESDYDYYHDGSFATLLRYRLERGYRTRLRG